MAITFLQAKKRQRYLVLILALVIVAILIIVWQGFLKGGALVSPAVPSLTHQKVLIDWSVLKDSRITELQSFAEILLFEGEIGRQNPFIPY